MPPVRVLIRVLISTLPGNWVGVVWGDLRHSGMERKNFAIHCIGNFNTGDVCDGEHKSSWIMMCANVLTACSFVIKFGDEHC